MSASLCGGGWLSPRSSPRTLSAVGSTPWANDMRSVWHLAPIFLTGCCWLPSTPRLCHNAMAPIACNGTTSCWSFCTASTCRSPRCYSATSTARCSPSETTVPRLARGGPSAPCWHDSSDPAVLGWTSTLLCCRSRCPSPSSCRIPWATWRHRESTSSWPIALLCRSCPPPRSTPQSKTAATHQFSPRCGCNPPRRYAGNALVDESLLVSALVH